MATRLTGNYAITLGAEDLRLREAENGIVSRFLLHVTAVAGTITIKARIVGSSDTIAAAACAYALGSTTSASTITATGFYVLDASGLDITISSGTSCTFSFVPIAG